MLRLSIKKKSMILFLILSTSIGLGFSSAFIVSKKAGKIDIFSDKLSRANIEILECRRQEKNFALRGFKVYGKDSLTSYEKWQNNFNDLKKLIKEIKESAIYRDEAEKTFNSAIEYSRAFSLFAKGIDENTNKRLINHARIMQENIKKIRQLEILKKEKMKKKFAKINLILMLISLSSLLIFVFILNQSLIKPVVFLSKTLENIASKEGDLTARLNIKRKDETGDLAKWFNIFAEKMRKIIIEISETSKTLVISSSKLTNISFEMKKSSAVTMDKSKDLSTAAFKLSSNIKAVSKASSDTLENLNSIASASTQIKDTISKIESTAFKTKDVTQESVLKSKTALNRMLELEESAGEIEKVAGTVSEISDQINLLSLNAAIEAARAGETGKGFAVVANEIKELARQTSTATMDIKKKNTWIQETTSAAICEIRESTKINDEVQNLTSLIADLIYEQKIAIEETNQNLKEALEETLSINKNLEQASNIASDTADDIKDIKSEAASVNSKAVLIEKNSEEISLNTFKIKEQIRMFKT